MLESLLHHCRKENNKFQGNQCPCFQYEEGEINVSFTLEDKIVITSDDLDLKTTFLDYRFYIQALVFFPPTYVVWKLVKRCFNRYYNSTINDSIIMDQAGVTVDNFYKTFQEPVYLQVWWFEKQVDYQAWGNWQKDNLYLAPLACAIYLVTIFSIRRFMESRNPFGLRKALFVWNAGLAAFSILAFLRSTPELQFVLGTPNGLHDSICRSDQHNYATIFWGHGFLLSKILELGDTIFIVLRKRRLLFLHYFHHVAVLFYLWSVADANDSTLLWFGVINSAVHSVMYSYYALKMIQMKIPRSISMAITFFQLAQMVAGVGLNVYVLFAKYMGLSCSTKASHANFCLFLYATVFLLFAKFFNKAYYNRQKMGQHVKSQ